MITSRGTLLLLDDFRVDHTLPKHTQPQEEYVGDEQGAYKAASSDEFMVWADRRRTFITQSKDQILSWFARLIQWVVNLFVRHDPRRIPIDQFFKSVHNSEKELAIVQGRAEGYKVALRKAKQAGQRALYERLEAGLNVYKMESQLLAIGLPRYVDEVDIVRFYKQSKKGLRLDWLMNFVRQVPDEVLAKKAHADKLGIFDNYAVLHYDPAAKSYAQTQEELQRKRDPILFGLMEGSRRLYCVGDWVDEFCDLTLDQIADALGKDAVKDIREETVV